MDVRRGADTGQEHRIELAMVKAPRQQISGDRQRQFGDVLRAFAVLEPDDVATRARLAKMLGFEFLRPIEATAVPPPRQRRRPEEVPQPDRPPRPPEEHAADEGSAGLEGAVPKLVSSGPTRPPVPLPGADSHPFKLQIPRARVRPRAARLSLFSPHVQRALLSGLLAQRGPTGAIDVDAIVARVARAQPIKELPRLARWSVRRSVDALVDMGDGMQPFRRDQVQLLDVLRRVIGAHRLKVGTFRDFPQTGVRMQRGPVRHFVPSQGASILLLAAPGEDLSLDPQGAIALWRTFFQEINAAGGRATVLSPIASAAHEPELIGRAALVTWDRTTGMGAVREARHARVRR